MLFMEPWHFYRWMFLSLWCAANLFSDLYQGNYPAAAFDAFMAFAIPAVLVIGGWYDGE